MNTTPCPMNTPSSIVTPSHTKVWLEILQFFPIRGVLLNFDEGPDLRVIADLAPVEIDEPREFHVLAQLHVRRDALIFAHRCTALPMPANERSAASSSLTTRKPAMPSLNGASPFWMQSIKYRASAASASAVRSWAPTCHPNDS